MLHRVAVAQAKAAALQCEAVYCGTAPGLCGKEGLTSYRDFHARMQAAQHRPEIINPNEPTSEEIAFFNSIPHRISAPNHV